MTNIKIEGLVGRWSSVDEITCWGKTFHLMANDTDEAPLVVVDTEGTPILTGIHIGFNDETVLLLKARTLPQELVPDSTVTLQDLEEYGYSWGNMLPVRAKRAAELITELDIYCVHMYGTVSKVSDISELNSLSEKHGLFSVYAEDWLTYLEKKNLLNSKIQSPTAEPADALTLKLCKNCAYGYGHCSKNGMLVYCYLSPFDYPVEKDCYDTCGNWAESAADDND